MDVAQKIDPVDWMMSPEVKAIMAVLQEDGADHQALFVGGCVRNTLMNKLVEDIDIATIWTPELVIEKCEAAGVKVIPTGVEYGTVTAVVDGRAFEITTLRKDVETDGRRAVVAFSTDWAEDAQRRDFTMNTLLLDAQGNIYDPTGQGLDDLHRRRVVFVGDAKTRIAEDYLRVLRFFRFHAMYGDGDMDEVALAACRDAAAQVEGLSKERITQEFFKLLSADNPVPVLDVMFENGILDRLKHENYNPPTLFELCKIQNELNMGYVPGRVFVLAGLDLSFLSVMSKLLLFPKVFVKDIESISHVLDLGLLDHDLRIKEAVYRYGRTAAAQALLVQAAQGHFEMKYLAQPLETIVKWAVPTFPVSGEDLIAAGYSPGPALGQKLEEIESWWIAQGLTPDKEACLAKN